MTIHHLSLSSIPPYEGPNAIPGIRFRALRDALGVTVWGMNVLEFEPHNEAYPEHTHDHDGQEEVYLVLSGEITLRTPEQTVTLETGDACRVPADVRRKLVTGVSPATVLALGGTPGKPFTPTM
ncbi:MAG: cupin domain-containing protein [Myxococcales bacterium]|nr:cupin domain-containing protein [Myxococcales bacterium]